MRLPLCGFFEQCDEAFEGVCFVSLEEVAFAGQLVVGERVLHSLEDVGHFDRVSSRAVVERVEVEAGSRADSPQNGVVHDLRVFVEGEVESQMRVFGFGTVQQLGILGFRLADVVVLRRSDKDDLVTQLVLSFQGTSRP